MALRRQRGTLSGSAYTQSKGFVCWRSTWNSRYQSLWGLFERFVAANAVNGLDALKYFGIQYRQSKGYLTDANELLKHIDVNKFSLVFGSAVTTEFETWMKVFVEIPCYTTDVDGHLRGKLLSSHLRICPECIAFGYHSQFHQYLLLENCPFHPEIKLIACCPSCSKSELYDINVANSHKPFHFKCGHTLHHSDGKRLVWDRWNESNNLEIKTPEILQWLELGNSTSPHYCMSQNTLLNYPSTALKDLVASIGVVDNVPGSSSVRKQITVAFGRIGFQTQNYTEKAKDLSSLPMSLRKDSRSLTILHKSRVHRYNQRFEDLVLEDTKAITKSIARKIRRTLQLRLYKKSIEGGYFRGKQYDENNPHLRYAKAHWKWYDEATNGLTEFFRLIRDDRYIGYAELIHTDVISLRWVRSFYDVIHGDSFDLSRTVRTYRYADVPAAIRSLYILKWICSHRWTQILLERHSYWLQQYEVRQDTVETLGLQGFLHSASNLVVRLDCPQDSPESDSMTKTMIDIRLFRFWDTETGVNMTPWYQPPKALAEWYRDQVSRVLVASSLNL